MLDTNVVISRPCLKGIDIRAADVSAAIGFSGHAMGSVVLCFSKQVARKVASKFAGGEISVLNADLADALGELANMVAGLANGKMDGLRLSDGVTIESRAVVLTTGTFMSAIMHTGETTAKGGRVGDRSSDGLSPALASLGFELGRLKTCTPPRLDGRTIDFSGLELQPPDEIPQPFSFETERISQTQVNCWTYEHGKISKRRYLRKTSRLSVSFHSFCCPTH